LGDRRNAGENSCNSGDGTLDVYDDDDVIRVILVAGKVFTHNCDTGKLSALINVETCRK
jgi:hypothetical protein